MIFLNCFQKDNIIAVLVFSILFGVAINMAGEKGKQVKEFVQSANEVVANIVKIIMYYAPIGLGCYFAAFVGSFGASIAVGYLKTFVVYTIVAIAFFFVMYTIYAWVAGGTKGIRAFLEKCITININSIGYMF